MNWRDLLYFSKGERRALTLLAALIAAAWLLLLLNESAYSPFGATPPAPLPERIPAASGRTWGERTGKLRSERSVSAGSNVSSFVPSVEKPGSGSDSETNFKVDSETGSETNSETVDFSTQGSGIGFSGSSRSFRPRAASAYSSSSASRNAGHASPSSYPRVEKFPPGTLVELNTADTLVLKKVPGIGSAFAGRIVKYRRLLGGFYSVGQLSEVYGIDEDRYMRLYPWFRVDSGTIRPIRVNGLLKDTLFRHPYLTARQLRVLRQQLRQKGKLHGWENLSLLEEFTEYDRKRLKPYFSFE